MRQPGTFSEEGKGIGANSGTAQRGKKIEKKNNFAPTKRVRGKNLI